MKYAAIFFSGQFYCILNKLIRAITEVNSCVKSVLIWSYSGPHFPRILLAFGLNTERYGISPYSVRMRENVKKMWTRIIPNTEGFSESQFCKNEIILDVNCCFCIILNPSYCFLIFPFIFDFYSNFNIKNNFFKVVFLRSPKLILIKQFYFSSFI